jgi:hypothetical protein
LADAVIADADADADITDASQHPEKREQSASSAPKQNELCSKTKKEQGDQPCSKNCVDPIFPKIGFDLD